MQGITLLLLFVSSSIISATQLESMASTLSSFNSDKRLESIANFKPIPEQRYWRYARCGDTKKLSRTIEKHKDKVNGQNQFMNTALHLAVARALSLDAVNLLIEKGEAQLNLQNNNGQTPLHVAVSYPVNSEEYKQSFLIAMAILNSAKLQSVKLVDIQDIYGKTPLHIAIETGSFSLVYEMVANHGADVKISDNMGRNAFHLAVKSGSIPIVEYLASIEAAKVMFGAKAQVSAKRGSEKSEHGNHKINVANPMVLAKSEKMEEKLILEHIHQEQKEFLTAADERGFKALDLARENIPLQEMLLSIVDDKGQSIFDPAEISPSSFDDESDDYDSSGSGTPYDRSRATTSSDGSGDDAFGVSDDMVVDGQHDYDGIAIVRRHASSISDGSIRTNSNASSLRGTSKRSNNFDEKHTFVDDLIGEEDQCDTAWDDEADEEDIEE